MALPKDYQLTDIYVSGYNDGFAAGLRSITQRAAKRVEDVKDTTSTKDSYIKQLENNIEKLTKRIKRLEKRGK